MTRSEQLLLWGSSAATALTGAVYGVMKYGMKTDDPYAVVNHPWQPFFLKAHVLAAPVLVFAIGAIFSKHVVRQWKSYGERGKRSGGAILAVAGSMIASGYVIQIVTAESWIRWIGWTHLGLGVLYTGAIVIHRRAARWLPEAKPRVGVVTTPSDPVV